MAGLWLRAASFFWKSQSTTERSLIRLTFCYRDLLQNVLKLTKMEKFATKKKSNIRLENARTNMRQGCSRRIYKLVSFLFLSLLDHLLSFVISPSFQNRIPSLCRLSPSFPSTPFSFLSLTVGHVYICTYCVFYLGLVGFYFFFFLCFTIVHSNLVFEYMFTYKSMCLGFHSHTRFSEFHSKHKG